MRFQRGALAELLGPLLTFDSSHHANIVGPTDISSPDEAKQASGIPKVHHRQPAQVTRGHPLDGKGHRVIRGDRDDTRRRNIACGDLINGFRFHGPFQVPNADNAIEVSLGAQHGETVMMRALKFPGKGGERPRRPDLFFLLLITCA